LNDSSKGKDYVLTILSAVLLIFAFPKTGFWIFAWIGMVPLLCVLQGKGYRQAFGAGYLCGLIFFSGTLFWISHVTVLGTVLLMLYLSLYFGLFGMGVSFFRSKTSLAKVIYLSSLWVVLEFIRGHLFSGFGWSSLGQSQYQNLVVIQIADMTGMYGVSFVVIMSNISIKEFLSVMVRQKNSKSVKELLPAALVTVATLLIVSVYGLYHLRHFFQAQKIAVSSENLSVALIQANTNQDMKWQESAWPAIMKSYEDLTEIAAIYDPDLIIWPETAFPGFLGEDDDLLIDVQDLVARLNKPLLFGSVLREGDHYFNTAVLMSSSSELINTYKKLHLVPFGEFVPFRHILPILTDIVPIDDFTPGKEYTVFSFLPKKSKSSHPFRFSVLICFEDTLAYLSRGFVNAGAQFLVNITNDAWFKDTAAPWMHLQSSVFRTVENRRHLIRVANTGVSCFIDPYGRIYNFLHDSRNRITYTQGYVIDNVSLSNTKTFYTRFGDVFTFLCFGCILMGIIPFGRRKASLRFEDNK